MTLLVEEHADRWVLVGDDFQLDVARQASELELEVRGHQVAHLPLSVATSAADTGTVLGPPALVREGESATVVWTGRSAAWRRKVLDLRVDGRAFSVGLEVDGTGPLDDLRFFGTRGGQAGFTRLFNPEPNLARQQLIDPAERAVISVGQEGGNWFFTPAPFAFALEVDENAWLGMGVAAERGGWRFSDLVWPGGPAGFCLELTYDGQTHVSGGWRSPRLAFRVADDPYQVLERYGGDLRAAGLAPRRGRGRLQDWWCQPIFCGWGEQVALQTVLGTPAQDHARQANYERWLDVLERQGLDPGTVLVDDKWQRAYGLNDVDTVKWPDLRGFIAGQHTRGRHVLLWLKAWDVEGLPGEECILADAGTAVAADPGSPAYAARLAGQVHHMLRELDADGFKLDFTQTIPRGTGIRASAGGLWGLELQRQWLAIVSEAAHTAKPEAMLVAHTAHPYLADLVDVLRLNDLPAWSYADHTQSVVPDMRHRARVARAASPSWLLDSDNWPMCSRAQLRDYARTQGSGELGIPSLYYAEHLEWAGRVERLDAADYAAVREAWARYRAGLASSSTS